jgi:hypothetical protein
MRNVAVSGSKFNNLYYCSNYKLYAFFHVIFTLVLFIFLSALKSFGLLTTELHLFSDPCSLSLLQELRNKPFIRSSVTLCSRLTSRLETEKH